MSKDPIFSDEEYRKKKQAAMDAIELRFGIPKCVVGKSESWSEYPKRMLKIKSYWRRNRDEARAFIAMMGFGILFAGALAIGSYNTGEPRQQTQEPVPQGEAQPEAYIIPDPCGLEVIGGCFDEIEKVEEIIRWDMTVEDIIRTEAVAAGVDPDTAIRIANCESSMNPYARNEQSGAQGLFQFLPSTWEWIASPGDPYSPHDNARAFANWYPTHPHWWVCK